MITKENVYSAIIGGVVADALGVPYEFSFREEMQKHPATGMRGYGTYNQPPGTWSDDSSMTLATMDSLINGINYKDMITKFCSWIFDGEYTPYDEVFDCGKTTLSALENFRYNDMNPLNCGLTGEHDNGNGSLMRIMPAILYANAAELIPQEKIEFINNVSALTHAHPISQASCNIYRFIAEEILEHPEKDFKKLIVNGIDKSREYYDNNEYECFNRIYTDLFDMDDDDLSSKGYVVYSLEISLYSCYHTNSYKEAVLKAINYGRDTDTNGIISGGLAALYYGYDSIPEIWLEQIVKLDYIKDLCKEFFNSF
ncbi:MAG: ADP-ribosylglycohydrolase [Methanosphaera stadtmanae]|nr:ADP-ribosylglycohydrolase [Methanosphaera stadtmanae]